MNTKYQTKTVIAVAALALVLPLLAQETTPAPRPRLGRENAVLLTMTGVIQAIDYTNREVTLRDPRSGRVETINVSNRVKRLDEAKVGDAVTLEYYVGFAVELRKPTPEEEQHPLTFLEAAGKAGEDAPPAAGGVRRFKAVVTIEGLDRPTRTVTVKGPLGKYWVARVADPERLTQARIGDNIVITCTEALAVSLEKGPQKDSDKKKDSE